MRTAAFMQRFDVLEWLAASASGRFGILKDAIEKLDLSIAMIEEVAEGYAFAGEAGFPKGYRVALRLWDGRPRRQLKLLGSRFMAEVKAGNYMRRCTQGTRFHFVESGFIRIRNEPLCKSREFLVVFTLVASLLFFWGSLSQKTDETSTATELRQFLG